MATTGKITTTSVAGPFRQLYPPIEATTTDYLKVDETHELYWEESGSPTGQPVCVLHGGPGGGCPAYYRQYFDASKYRIIMHDQRGAGKSRPHASLKDNTTQHLVADIETLRKNVKVDKWVVFGGSWGSTLALAYAEAHPDRVTALVLRGVFMLRREELLYFYQQGASFQYPERFEQYLEVIPVVQRHDIMSAYHRLLTNENDKATMLKAASAWSAWEMATSKLLVDEADIQKASDDADFALAFARIENHYFVNGGFFRSDTQLLDDADKIAHIPTVIVHGRYDLVCPFKNAWDLKKKLPKADLYIVPNAGHSCKEEGIRHQLLEATDKFASL